jgi:hypothetical protein
MVESLVIKAIEVGMCNGLGRSCTVYQNMGDAIVFLHLGRSSGQGGAVVHWHLQRHLAARPRQRSHNSLGPVAPVIVADNYCGPCLREPGCRGYPDSPGSTGNDRNLACEFEWPLATRADFTHRISPSFVN